eukprot:TRINITY_DN4341_c0_g1_i1.p1 TRINITY_DN4341_c0_g1~~TRINITY_DN4341_c0_g1_i1.p1  ORF type:complete len:547 (+),score=211.45 TRINITY_DN4341_c0_g1_i1:82-1722(+)
MGCTASSPPSHDKRSGARPAPAGKYNAPASGKASNNSSSNDRSSDERPNGSAPAQPDAETALAVAKVLEGAKQGFVQEFRGKQASIKTNHAWLPEQPSSYEDVLQECKDLAGINGDYSQGQYSGCVYHGGGEGYTEFINKAMALHQWTNPMHAGQFSGVRKMEAEVLSMVVNMFHGDAEACGALTSGGTESILLAMKAYRDLAKAERGITAPELVVPVTAHAAFDKAAHYFGLEIRHARIDPETCKVDLEHMRSLITPNTVALVASAPHFPHGIIDPVEDIAKMGFAKGIPVHVDACLGGFVIAFMEKAGLELDEKFDFRVKGVTSISCDTHKYGFSPKGSSTILYRSTHLRRYQMHSQPNWPGGIYASPTISGSRAGNIIAGTWAAMVAHGEAGYVKEARAIVLSARYIAEELSKIPGIKVLGKPLASVVAFASDDFDVYRMVTYLGARHWDLNVLQYPSALHICCTKLHAAEDMKHAKRFVADVTAGAAECMANPKAPATGGAALYGTSQSIPDRNLIGEFAKTFFDAYYMVHEPSNGEASPAK